MLLDFVLLANLKIICFILTNYAIWVFGIIDKFGLSYMKDFSVQSFDNIIWFSLPF